MNSFRRRALFCVCFGCAITAAPALFALPDPNEPIDPTKRAPISTSNAIQPSAAPMQGNGVVPIRVIRMSEIPITRAPINTATRAPVNVQETRAKKIITPTTRALKVKAQPHTFRAGDLPASIPRLDPNRYRKLISAYQKGRVPADELLNTDVTLGNRRVSIGDINRYASPRAALEAQGIPVVPAASGPAPESSSAPIPVSQEKGK